MSGTVEIIEDEDGYTPLDEETRERLELLGISMSFDFLHNELSFHIGEEECALFDFEDFIIQEIEKETIEQSYLASSEEIPEGLEETLEILQEHIDTNIYIFGEGWYRYLAIQLYNCYIVLPIFCTTFRMTLYCCLTQKMKSNMHKNHLFFLIQTQQNLNFHFFYLN